MLLPDILSQLHTNQLNYILPRSCSNQTCHLALPLSFSCLNLLITMEFPFVHPSIPLLSIFIFLLPSSIHAQMCQRNGGKETLKYPFGSNSDCGSPLFQPHITCNQPKLTFTTHTGTYPITSIDQTNHLYRITVKHKWTWTKFIFMFTFKKK